MLLLFHTPPPILRLLISCRCRRRRGAALPHTPLIRLYASAIAAAIRAIVIIYAIMMMPPLFRRADTVADVAAICFIAYYACHIYAPYDATAIYATP